MEKHGPCSTCRGIWFWSEFSVGSLRCVACTPPTEKLKRGPGIIQPDGSLLTPESVTAHIESTIVAARLARARSKVGPGWKHLRNVGVVIVPALRQGVAPCRKMSDVPDAVVIRPGDPDWVDRRVIERAVAKRRTKTRGKTKATALATDVATSQAVRIAHKPKRKN